MSRFSRLTGVGDGDSDSQTLIAYAVFVNGLYQRWLKHSPVRVLADHYTHFVLFPYQFTNPCVPPIRPANRHPRGIATEIFGLS